jgi:23S rRNA (pseudouridine1915-N3)-methyltransferase
MKIKLVTVGKTRDAYLLEGINNYLSRIKHYNSIEYTELADVKSTTNNMQATQREYEQIIKQLKDSDYIVLLDEKGKQLNSIQFADFINKKQNAGIKRVVFIIGGAYGFSPDTYSRANEMISLSRMTFTHQMVRLIFAEQLYRAFTILKGEKYHH